MAVYPYYNDLQKVASNMTKGNFGLWYNKFIPITDSDHKKSPYKASDNKGDPDNAVGFYAEHYGKSNKTDLHKILSEKHLDQAGFCGSFSSKYETVVFEARLKTPLITGIGETHPHEVSLVFEHNLGIPYIPASGIKGIVRFAHTLGLIDKIPDGKLVVRDKDDKPCSPHFNDEDDWTGVPQLFGTQKNRGKVFFLDAYPEKMPDLHVDIMNPHYGDYYSDDTNRTPPGDYLNPIPLKFLTVAKDTVFIFRALVDKDSAGLIDKVKTAFKKALTEEGVGAKTAIGYGLFEINEDVEVLPSVQILSVPRQEVKAIDKYIAAIKILKPTDAGPIGNKIDEALKKLESEEDKKALAQAVKTRIGKAFKNSKAETKLKSFLG